MGVDLAGPPRWRTLAASVAGTSHACAGQPCADAGAVRALGTNGGGSLLVAVAADGAGSSPRAPEGARLACETILERAARWAGGARRRRGPGGRRALANFGRREVRRWTAAARRRIEGVARAGGADSRDFSCTLLVALVDDVSAVFFQLGDGAIVYRDAGGRYVPALWPQSGEYANCTWFVTDEDATERVESAAAGGVDELALLTDGLQGLALRYASREAHGPFFEPMFARLRRESDEWPEGLDRELRAFLESPAVNRRTDDDKTLILATRLPAAPRNGQEE